MKKIGVVLAGAVLSVVMAVSMIPADIASAKVSVKEKKLETTLFEKDGKLETEKTKITIKGTTVKKKKGVTVKKTVAAKSSDTKVVKVDKKGNVTYVGEGTAKITITETIKTTSKNKAGKKVTKTTKSTATVPVTVSVKKIEKVDPAKVSCSCGCAECLAGKCNTVDGCVCTSDDCEGCEYEDYEGGYYMSEDDEDEDDEYDLDGEDDEDDLDDLDEDEE